MSRQSRTPQHPTPRPESRTRGALYSVPDAHPWSWEGRHHREPGSPDAGPGAKVPPGGGVGPMAGRAGRRILRV